MININKQNSKFNIKLRVFELNFIYLTSLNFIFLIKSIIKIILIISANEKLKKSSNYSLSYSKIINVPILKDSPKYFFKTIDFW